MTVQQHDLTEEQRRILGVREGRRVRVLGGPGTGKTTAAIGAVVDFVARGGSPDRVLLLTGSRDTASRIRDEIAGRVSTATPGPMARTFASLAHAIVRQRSMIEHGAPPVLLGGSDEDARWREVIEVDAALAAGIQWPDRLTHRVRSLPEFRGELREFIARATERGMTPDDLLAHASELGHGTWQAVARIWQQFELGLRLEAQESARTVTTPALLREATAIAQAGTSPRFELLVVDDAQELTRGQFDFLLALAGQGRARASVVLLGNPDTATGMFRGAQPGLMNDLEVDDTITLAQSFRLGSAVADGYATVIERVGIAGATSQRRFSAATTSQLVVESAPSAAAETRAVTDFLRQQHLVSQVPWSNMAVIARTSGIARQFASALEAQGIPTSRSGAAPLRDSLAVRTLIEVMALATGRQELDIAQLHRLLGSPYVDFDTIALRRFRRALRVSLLEAGSNDDIDARMVDMFTAPERFEALQQTNGVRRAKRLAEILAETKGHANDSPQDLLWRIWESFDREDVWAEQSTKAGVVARTADEHLDAVVALMRHVGFVTERQPTLTAGQFVDQWLAASVDDDSLARRAVVDAVSVGTPSAFVGREFDTVCVVAVNESVWPNLRLRSSLLDAAAFVRGAASREEVRSDEARLLALAVSRARRRLLVTAEHSESQEPSEFARRLGITLPIVRNATTLPALVAQLRRALTDPASDDESRQRAASALRMLADRGVDGASPDQWAGRQPLTGSGPKPETSEVVTVSPSKIERFEDCQVQWIAGNLAGDSVGTQRQVGTIVHAAVERARTFTADEIERLALARWNELKFESTWEEERSRSQLRELAERLAEYFEAMHEDGYHIDPDTREVKFETSFGNVRMRGSIDWVERSGNRIRVADLKTGKTPPSQAKVDENPQLKSYQLAVAAGDVPALAGLHVVDARLVYPLKEVKTVSKRALQQTPLDDGEREEFRQRVAEAAALMSGDSFVAHPSRHCEKESTFRPDCAFHIIEQVTS